ncbi:MAG: hypothetical protein J6Z22_03400, partial [Lachnospiraceae bacterium]|nr:hypothetical protein [Lachnospiraceae bacterium]
AGDYLEAVTMVNAKASLEGKIGLVYGVTLPDWIKDDPNAYAIITVAGQEYRKSLAKVVAAGQAGDGTYRIAQYVPASYYRETMNLRIFTGDGMRAPIVGASNGRDYTETGVDYSLMRYVTAVRNSGVTGASLDLVNAIEDYCTAAQIYFGYNSEGLSVSNTVKNLSPDVLSGYASTGSQSYITGIIGKKLTVTFEADNSIKLGLTFDSAVNLDDYTFYVDGARASLKYQDGFGNYLIARNIPAALLDVPHEFKATKGNEVYIINCSALTYARAIVGSTDDKVTNLAKALYLYNLAAKNYFGIQ